MDIPVCPGCFTPISDRNHTYMRWGNRIRAYCSPGMESPITNQDLLEALIEGQPA